MTVANLGSRTANSARTAQGTEDVNFTLPNNEDPIILGVGMGATDNDRLRPEADLDPDSTLQFKTGGGGFVDVATASGAVRLTSATNLVDDNALLSGERLSTGTGVDGAYINGLENETGNKWTAAEVRDPDFSEWQWGLDFSNAADSTQYDFRMDWGMKNGQVFTTYISITTVVSAGGGGSNQGWIWKHASLLWALVLRLF